MNVNEYMRLSEEKKKQFQSKRTCSCGTQMVRDGHSTGDLHVICPECRLCPDCEDGE